MTTFQFTTKYLRGFAKRAMNKGLPGLLEFSKESFSKNFPYNEGITKRTSVVITNIIF